MGKAQLISGATFSYAEGSALEPTSWTTLNNTITDLPEMFTKPDTVDTTTIDNTTQTNIPGLSGGDSLDFGVLINETLINAHATMYASQNNEAKGDAWFKLEYAAPVSRKMIWRGSVPEHITQAGGKATDLLTGTLSIYPSTDIEESAVSTSV